MESLTKLDMRPDDDQGQDASAWRERLALSKMDECSNHVFKMYQHKAEERGQLKLLYKDTARKRRVRVAENGVAATIIADTDLVTFRFNYGITQTSMIMLERGLQNKNIFAGISKVGIEIELLRDGYKHTPRFKPFWFPCHHGNAHPPGACWNGVVKFLRWFENLEVVYIIIQITWRDISVVRTLLSYAPPPPPSRRPDQVPVGVVAHMRDLGQRMNLEQFHDRMGTYYVITKRMLQLFPTMSPYIRRVAAAWQWSHQNTPPGHAGWQSVEFKPLLFRDFQGALNHRDGCLLRRPRPW